MNCRIAIWFILVLCGSQSLAQLPCPQHTRVDMNIIKNQSYLHYAAKVNCNNTSGSALEERICANLELQRQDSLLQVELQAILTDYQLSGDTIMVTQLRCAQDIWETYRAVHCNTHGEGHSAEMITYMQCLAEVTRNRREELKRFSNE